VKIVATAFEHADPALVLKTVFGYDSFRPLQKDIITNILKGKDTLAVMPTGGGKSLCYQLPALILEGITIVVSPLISLMQDQVSSLETAGIHSAFLNSSLSWEEYCQAVNEIKAGEVKIVYVSPEGLATAKIRELLSSLEQKISCITIDEAHCVSQWGHDFRPDYLEIKTVRHLFPDAVMLALTATATEHVRQDICQNLGMKNPKIFISSFNRENIYLEVLPKRNALQLVIDCIRKHSGESGIIYCNSRKQVDELAETLDKKGYSILPYHAGLSDDVRAKNQDLFIKDEVQIIVATIAFGMGINKPNVRYVINYDLPKSIEEYYQEIGRAGRDGLPSSALLLYSHQDIHKIRWFFQESASPEKDEILLQGMIKYATSRICRRKALLQYFGEAYEPAGGESDKTCCCDICSAGDIPLQDVTIPAQKLICCIIRTSERFGAGYVVDVLLGSNSQRIADNGHDKITTWGIGKEYNRAEWLELTDLLIDEGYIMKTGEYNVLEVTPLGKKFIAARTELQLPMRPDVTRLSKKTRSDATTNIRGEKITAEKPAVNDTQAEAIITNLKAWRKRKADDLNVPPYVIFGDKTLLDLAAKKPKSRQDLLNVYGIGRVKAEEFGRSILQIIEES
jgi:ATP-dependent DNA helicase RecQ